MYQLLESQVSKYFTVDRDLESEDYVKEHHKEIVTLYRLHPVIENDNSFERAINRGVFTHNNIQQIYNSITFLFYMRNIYGNTTLEELWSKLSFFFNDVDYIDQEVIQEDIELLARFAKNAPNSIENLKGLKLSEQISLIKKFFEKFKDDPIVAISILEKQKVDKDIELDENTSLLLELSVRKEIINDTRGKVYKIFGIKSESDEPTNDISWLF